VEVRVGHLASRDDPQAHSIYNAVYGRRLVGDLDARFQGAHLRDLSNRPATPLKRPAGP
jgi:hypothetical protein